MVVVGCCHLVLLVDKDVVVEEGEEDVVGCHLVLLEEGEEDEESHAVDELL